MTGVGLKMAEWTIHILDRRTCQRSAIQSNEKLTRIKTTDLSGNSKNGKQINLFLRQIHRIQFLWGKLKYTLTVWLLGERKRLDTGPTQYTGQSKSDADFCRRQNVQAMHTCKRADRLTYCRINELVLTVNPCPLSSAAEMSQQMHNLAADSSDLRLTAEPYCKERRLGGAAQCHRKPRELGLYRPLSHTGRDLLQQCPPSL